MERQGLLGHLTSGMRVDALFYAAGTDGAPYVPEHFLYALRNAEVISSAAARKSDHGTISQRTTVRVSGEQLLEIQALAPAAVEILVVQAATPSRTPAGERSSGHANGARGHSTAGGGVHNQPGNQDASWGRTWQTVERHSSLEVVLRAVFWGALGYLTISCCVHLCGGRRYNFHPKAKTKAPSWYRLVRVEDIADTPEQRTKT